MKCFNCNEEMIYRDDIRGLEHADMPYGTNTNSLIVKKTEIMEGLFSQKEVEVNHSINPNYYICPNCGLALPVISKANLEILFKQENTDE